VTLNMRAQGGRKRLVSGKKEMKLEALGRLSRKEKKPSRKEPPKTSGGNGGGKRKERERSSTGKESLSSLTGPITAEGKDERENKESCKGKKISASNKRLKKK